MLKLVNVPYFFSKILKVIFLYRIPNYNKYSSGQRCECKAKSPEHSFQVSGPVECGALYDILSSLSPHDFNIKDYKLELIFIIE